VDYNILENLNGQCLSISSDKLIYYSHIPVIIVSLLFGFFVLLKSRKSLLGKVLFFICFSYSLWLIFDFIVWTQFNLNRLLTFLWGMQDILSVIIFTLTLYFIYVFLDKKDVSLRKKFAIFLITLPIVIATPTRLGVNLFNINTCEVSEGDLYLNYLLSLQLLISVWIVYLLVSRYIRSKELIEKKQIKFLALGTSFYLLSIFVIAFITTLFDNYSIELYSLFSIIPFLGILSYLVIRHQMFDIRVVAAQFLTVTVWLMVFSQFFIVQERSNQILTGITLLLVTYFGWLLFRAVREEVETGKQLSLAGRKLAGLNAKLEELDRAKSEFISIASHQLRTPLTSVKGFTSLILDNTFGKIPIGQKKSVEKIFVNNEKLCLLVEDMLNASRLEAGRLEYELEEADLVSVVKSTVDIISLYAKSKRIKLAAIYPKEKELRAIIDQRKVSEILSNLIDNAIKYTPKGSVTVTLEKFSKAVKVGKAENTGMVNGCWARISVRDTGIGMDEKQTEEIFNKFKEGGGEESRDPLVKPEDNKKSKVNGSNANNMTVGTGLGVYISRQMAEAMGGKLTAASPGKNKGSTFILELPLVKK